MKPARLDCADLVRVRANQVMSESIWFFAVDCRMRRRGKWNSAKLFVGRADDRVRPCGNADLGNGHTQSDD